MTVKEQYWKYSLIIIILVMGIILFLEFTPFLSGILGALTIYVLVRKQMQYLTEKRHMKRMLAAILILFEVVLCFLIPISLVVWLLINKLQDVNLTSVAFIEPAQHFANLIQTKTGYDILSKDNITSVASSLPKLGQLLAGSISSFSINILALVFVIYFMLIGGRKMEDYIYDILPFNNENKKNVLEKINMIVKSNAIGIPLLAIIQGGIAFIGYLIFGAPNPVLLGFLTCFATILPIIGTSLVWLPLVIYLALTGNWVGAIGLAAYSIIIITNIDNLIRFILQKRLANTHPLITIFGVVIGLSLFGFMGIIFGPLLLSVFILCVNMFKEKYLDEKD